MTDSQSGHAFVGGPLGGFTVLEVGDERAEFCGRLLTGGHANVVKVEPRGGNATRRYGPFFESEGAAHSIYFWHYNLGKRSVTLDLDNAEGQALFRRLAAGADVVLDGAGPDYLAARGLGYEALAAANPRLVLCSITDFGPSGPWRDYQASDLVHLAVGGQMMVCGYTPSGDYDPTDPGAAYDTPPIAPQMWQAYHTTGINAATAIYGALFYREVSGRGQRIDVSIHQAMAACTEFAVPHWIYNHRRVWRQTSSHASPQIGTYQQRHSTDGRLVFAMGSVGLFGDEWQRLVDMLDEVGLADDLKDERYDDRAVRSQPEVATRVNELVTAFVAMLPGEESVRRAQQRGLAWSVIRWPEDNIDDEHWQARDVFEEIEHDELGGERFTYVGKPFLSDEMPWKVGPRAATPGEHTDAVLSGELGLNGEQIAQLRANEVV